MDLMRTKILFAALLGAMASVSHAAMYRCSSADGAPLYQQTPCAADSIPVDLAPLNTLGDGLRPGERQWLKSTQKHRQEVLRRQRRPSVASHKRQQAKQCLRKRQQYDAVRAKLRRGYKPTQGESLRRRRDDYAEYLREFCD